MAELPVDDHRESQLLEFLRLTGHQTGSHVVCTCSCNDVAGARTITRYPAGIAQFIHANEAAMMSEDHAQSCGPTFGGFQLTDGGYLDPASRPHRWTRSGHKANLSHRHEYQGSSPDSRLGEYTAIARPAVTQILESSILCEAASAPEFIFPG